jgi:uncharacterized protein
MRDIADIARFIAGQARLRGLLLHVESLCLPDCWIGAGTVRNAVWDALHERELGTGPYPDVDVIFFDAADIRDERDAAIERQLRVRDPEPLWSVKNQARMHLRNGDSAYGSTLHAMTHWPETATAVAVCSIDGRIEVTAPYGVDDLLGLVVRPTPRFAAKLPVYRERVAAKNWQIRWPMLTIVDF